MITDISQTARNLGNAIFVSTNMTAVYNDLDLQTMVQLIANELTDNIDPSINVAQQFPLLTTDQITTAINLVDIERTA